MPPVPPPSLEITPAQCRAARGLLGWTQEELGKQAGITMRTVIAFEKGENRPQAGTMGKLVTCLQDAGIRFSEERGVVGSAP